MFSSRCVRILLTQFNTRKILIGEANYAQYARKLRRNKADPGIAARKTLVDDKEAFEELEDHDFDFEADFMNVGSAYDQNLREEGLHRERLKHLIVKQKYFKEKLPNFLSWSDKEQIRHLHKTNPEEWTIERLAEGFPVLPDVVAKIIKGTWMKTTQHKKINHDKSVEENWKLFNEGKMKDLPPDVVEHLRKFSGRKSNSTSVESSVTLKNGRELPKTKATEFLDIIRSYRKDNKNNAEEPAKLNDGCQDLKPQQYSYVENPTKGNQKHATLSRFTEKLATKSAKGSIEPNEEFMLKNLEKKQEDLEITESDFESTGKPVATLPSLNDNKYHGSEVTKVVKRKASQVLDKYPERIRIPSALYKPGATYKLNDCYYDDDGEFLYRVPGMYK